MIELIRGSENLVPLEGLADYETSRTGFRWNLPTNFNFAADVVDTRAARRPDLPALIWEGSGRVHERLSFSEVATRSRALAAQFANAGLRKGDRVIVMMPRIPAWQLTMVGLLRIGAVPIPCVTMLTAHDLEYRIVHSGAVAVIAEAAEAQKFDGIADGLLRFSTKAAAGFATLDPMSGATVDPAQVGIDDPGVLYYTSGSTGMPKGVLLAARSIYAWENSSKHWLALDEGDVIWCTADTGWSKAGTSILFGPWARGATAFCYDGPFEAGRRFELLEQHRVTCFCAPATELRRLVSAFDSSADLSALRLTVSAGEAVDPDTVLRWTELTGRPLLDGYGQTETLMTVTNRLGMAIRPGSMGRPLPGVDIGVLDADGEVVTGAAYGELIIRASTPQLMLGYLNDQERTDRVYLERYGERWFRTGDLVSVDLDGYVTYAGRTDDIINSAGYRIGPQEVENVLMKHEAVIDAAVVGTPDRERGEIVTAFVVLSSAGRELLATDKAAVVAELQQHVRTSTAPYKYPRRIEFLNNLPRTPTGKVRRAALRDEFGGGAT